MKTLTGGGGGGEADTSASGRAKGALSGLGQGIGDAGDTLIAMGNRPVPQGGNEILKALAQLGVLEGRQEGGPVAPGQSVVTGERAPEVVTAQPGGGAQVTPLTPGSESPPARVAATPKQQGVDIVDHIRGALIGLFGGQEGLDRVRAANAQKQQFLATSGIQHPMILAQSPEVAQAVDSALGPGASQALLNEYDPNFQARAMAKVHGIQLVAPGSVLPDGTTAPSEIEQFNNAVTQKGAGLTYTSKGEMRVTQQPRSRESQDALVTFGLWDAVRSNLQSQGMNENQANVQAAKRAMQIAAQRGITVPDSISKLALASTDTAIAAARAGAEADARNASELRFGAPIAAAREAGTRASRLATPIGEDEIRARDVGAARKAGGVVYGREMKDADLLTAESSGQVFQLTPEGNYIGIPKDTLAKDQQAMYLDPRELLTKRIAQKMADKRTTQNENAQIVLGALDDIDNNHALELLPHAQPQGPGLAGQVGGAIATEIAGQTTGRLSVWAARRSPDEGTRNKAISLINLGTLSTSVVKALGDVGAISEADKQVFNQRLGRIMAGSASQEEAATMVQQIRQLMVRAAAGPITKQDTHDMLTNQPNPMAPPPGFTTFGQGFYRVNP